ncbi:MAG: 3-dehydroquinate synthase [Muribaculaceae bacterium]|nr:3-dehydroquinate synthase [Muribaculaceae bacterium]
MNKQSLPSDLKAALIDMDGVLYDSMPFHADAWYRMFKELDINGDPDEFYLYEGMTGAATVNLIFKRELGREATKEEVERLYKRKSEIFTGAGQKRMMPGASDMLATLRNEGIRTVLVTGSAQGSLLNSLDVDYPDCFPSHRRVTALDVTKGKPDPEPYLKGLEKAGVKRSEAIVIENAPLGVRAGKAAGIFTIAVTTGPIPREAFEKEGADMIFPDMPSFAKWLKENIISGIGKKIDKSVSELMPDKVLVVTDSNVNELVLPRINDSCFLNESPVVVVIPGEEGKSLNSAMLIWRALEDCCATRNSLIINIGGGMVTDLGGFAAAVFKRGIKFINVPTTILGAVDAASGGKTGINFNGLKNEIGAFHNPVSVIISSLPFETLSANEKLGGYAEMIKTALISDKSLYKDLLDVNKVLSDSALLENAIKRCVELKNQIVAEDSLEKGLRKILNFGHTMAHAFESMFFIRKEKLSHGFAVANGMLFELILSNLITGFPEDEVSVYLDKILKPHYPKIIISEDDEGRILELIMHDKKNRDASKPNFTLLKEIGEPIFDCEPSKETIKEALNIYRSMISTK